MILNNFLFSLYFRFLICKMGMRLVPALEVMIRLNELIHVKCLEWYPTQGKVFNKH